MTPDYEYIFKYGDPRVAAYPLTDSEATMFYLIAIYFVLVKFVLPMWMKNRPPYDFRRAMIVYNLFISALSFFIFLNFGLYGWFTKYKLRCEPVDYSSNEGCFKNSSALLVVLCHKIPGICRHNLCGPTKKYSFVTKIHVFHHCLAPIIFWYIVKYGPGHRLTRELNKCRRWIAQAGILLQFLLGYNTIFMFLNSFIHSNLYLYYCLAVIGIKTGEHLWWKKYIKIIQLIQFVITFAYCFQLYFFAPDNCKVSPFLLKIQLAVCFLFFNINLYTFRQIKAE